MGKFFTLVRERPQGESLPTAPTPTSSPLPTLLLFGTFDRRTWCLKLWQPCCDYDRLIFTMLRMAEQKGIFSYQKCDEAASHANTGVGGRPEQSHLALAEKMSSMGIA